MRQLAKTLFFILLLQTTSAIADPFPPELVGRHYGAMGQSGVVEKDGSICFSENGIGLGGLEFTEEGELLVSFMAVGEPATKLKFTFDKITGEGASAVWKPLTEGGDLYTAALHRYGSVFRLKIIKQHGDVPVAVTQWMCAEPSAADEPYPDVLVISKENGWKMDAKAKKNTLWSFEDTQKMMYAMDQNEDGMIDYLQLVKPIRSHHVSVWMDTDHDGYFDKRMGGKLKGEIKVPKLIGFGGPDDNLQNPDDDTLLYYLRQSDLVVVAKFTKIHGVAYRESGIANYGCEVRVNKVLRGDASVQNKTLHVDIIRLESATDKASHPLLEKDAECILFLNKSGTRENPRWTSADTWFGIQHRSGVMESSLKRLAETAFDR